MKTRAVAKRSFTSPEPKGLNKKYKATSTKERPLSKSRETKHSLSRKVISTPKDKTPKCERRKEVKTPLRDDILCSQHFDSQAEVGWDCNSPAAVRSLQRISENDDSGVSEFVMQLIRDESEDAPVTKRSTPPLLGIWRDRRDEDQLLEDKDTVPARFRRKRTRRKSDKDSHVSKDLLQKLTLALDKCSEADKETEQRDSEVEVFMSDEETAGVVENMVAKPNDTAECPTTSTSKTQVRVSPRLSEKNKILEIATGQEKGTDKAFATTDETWSDDELFEEDSFIINATQFSNEVKKFSSPLFGVKRRTSADNIQPQSKCTRYTFQLSNKGEHEKTSSAGVKHGQEFLSDGRQPSVSSRFTALQSKSAGIGLKSTCMDRKPPVSQRLRGNLHVGTTATSVVATHNSIAKQTPVIRGTSSLHGSSNIVDINRNVKLSSASSSSNSCVPRTNLARSGSFKKHNSFTASGNGCHDKESSPRQRSMSGDTSKRIWTGRPGQDGIQPQKEKKVLCATVSSSTFYGNSMTGVIGSSTSCSARKEPAAGPVTRASSKTDDGVSEISSPSVRKGRLSTESFDTSLSDELLCQLAEPDDVLDNQSIATQVTTAPASRVVNGAALHCRSNQINSSQPGIAISTEKQSLTSFSNMSRLGITKGAKKDLTLCPKPVANVKLNPILTTESQTSVQPKQFRFRGTQACAATMKAGDTVGGLCATTMKAGDSVGGLCATTMKAGDSVGGLCAATMKAGDTVGGLCAATMKAGDTVGGLCAATMKAGDSVGGLCAASMSHPTMKQMSHSSTVSNKNSIPVSINADVYSEDLFMSDDDDDLFLDDGLTEPEILAMLDEVELLATQQQKSSQSVKREGDQCLSTDYPSGSQGNQPSGSQGNQPSSSQNKYSPAEIERKKLEAIQRRKKKFSQC